MPHALQFLVLTLARCLNHHQEDLIDYLREENRVLREQRGSQPLRLADTQRRRLAIRGRQLGRRALTQVASIVTPGDVVADWDDFVKQAGRGQKKNDRCEHNDDQFVMSFHCLGYCSHG